MPRGYQLPMLSLQRRMQQGERYWPIRRASKQQLLSHRWIAGACCVECGYWAEMQRDREHFILQNLGQSRVFKAKNGGAQRRPNDVADRAAHAQALLQALDHLPDIAAE